MDRIGRIFEEKIRERSVTGDDDPFYLLDLDDVKMKHAKWVEKIPRVIPFYAVKCNDDERVLRALTDLGTGFDCASKKELKQMIELGVSPERIIYANTVKQVSHLKYAADQHVMKVTFDSPRELEKIREFHPKAQVVLRIRFDAQNSIICLGLKFGCDPEEEAPRLIRMCKELDMDLVGISFHVGSGTQDYEIFERALVAVRKLFDVAQVEGFKLNFVDIGGGFLGNDITLLDHYAKSINLGIDKNFAGQTVEFISEPGRYFVESAFTIAVQVILKRVTLDGHVHYHINEGIYGSFLISYIYEEKLKFDVVRGSKSNSTSNQVEATIWGASCNSKDKIFTGKVTEFEMYDWLVFRNFGAYTTTVSTTFNGFSIGETFSV